MSTEIHDPNFYIVLSSSLADLLSFGLPLTKVNDFFSNPDLDLFFESPYGIPVSPARHLELNENILDDMPRSQINQLHTLACKSFAWFFERNQLDLVITSQRSVLEKKKENILFFVCRIYVLNELRKTVSLCSLNLLQT